MQSTVVEFGEGNSGDWGLGLCFSGMVLDHMCLWLPKRGGVGLTGVFCLARRIRLALLHLTAACFYLCGVCCGEGALLIWRMLGARRWLFSSVPAGFCADGVFKLPDEWTKVNGGYRGYFAEWDLLKHYLSLCCKSEENAKNFSDNLI